MNYVAAMLLLCLDLSEERAFWVMVALIDDNGQSVSSHCAVKAGNNKYKMLSRPPIATNPCIAAVAVIHVHCVASKLHNRASVSCTSCSMLAGCSHALTAVAWHAPCIVLLAWPVKASL